MRKPFMARLMASMIEVRERVFDGLQERQAFDNAYKLVLDSLVEARRVYRQSSGVLENSVGPSGVAVTDVSFDTLAETVLRGIPSLLKCFNLSADFLLTPDVAFREGWRRYTRMTQSWPCIS
jgi:hypothetical protein